MSRKRARTMVSRRPIDKQLLYITHSVTNSQVSTDLLSSTSACTATGLRWDLDVRALTSTANNRMVWAIIYSPDGSTDDQLELTTDGNSFYQPEQNVLAFGVFTGSTDSQGQDDRIHFTGSTKTMRKLKKGDAIKFISHGFATGFGNLNGVIQIFCKE